MGNSRVLTKNKQKKMYRVKKEYESLCYKGSLLGKSISKLFSNFTQEEINAYVELNGSRFFEKIKAKKQIDESANTD